MNHGHLKRRPRRLPVVWVDDGHPCFFLTICTADRKPVLANADIHARLAAFLETSRQRYGWCPGRYVIMPDHIHLFLRRGDDDCKGLGSWVKALKAIVGKKEIRWQAGFFDHVLRGRDSAEEKWEYTYQNPVRAGLVENPEDWPFGGEIPAEDT